MDNEDIYTFIGAGFGVVIIISAIFLILMCLYIRRRKASQLQDKTKSEQRAASEKVLIEKANQGEIATQKMETSPQNGSAANRQNTPNTTTFTTQSYENIEIGHFPNQQGNCLVDTISPPNDDADMKQDVTSPPSQDEDVSTNDGPHLTEEVMLNQRNPDESDGISDAVSPLNEDNVEENKMYVSADEVKLNKKQSNDTMKDANMTSSSKNENANKNNDLYVMNVAYASADEVARIIKS